MKQETVSCAHAVLGCGKHVNGQLWSQAGLGVQMSVNIGQYGSCYAKQQAMTGTPGLLPSASGG